MTQSIQEQIGVLPAIKPEAHLFKVGRKMLCADMVPSAHHAALKERESVFDGVCMNVSYDIDFFGVIDCPVFGRWNARSFDRGWIGGIVIGKDHVHVFADVFADVLGHCLRLDIIGMEQSKFSIALANPDDDLLVFRTPALVASPADVGFIHLNFPVEHWFVRFDHSGPDAMAEIPRGLVADSDGPLNLAGRHPFLSLTKKQCGHEPFRQWQVGVIEDRASRHGELIVTVFAVEQFLVGFQFNRGLLAARALNASGPAETAQQFTAPLVGRELRSHVC